jgi:single-strand DNA-binding protein
MREWEKDGTKHLSPDIRVDEIELQGGKQSDASGDSYAKASGGSRKPAAKGDMSDLDDSIPFN